MNAKLLTQSVGPWPMNAYVVICEETATSAVIDPGAEVENILAMTAGTRIDKILLTHGHFDHVDALDELLETVPAPVYLHPADAEKFGLQFDTPLADGLHIPVGNLTLKAIHAPGHTPGQVCFDLGDGRIISGDTIFVGGPGKTWSATEFAQTMRTMQAIVFAWPDETQFSPGHGLNGIIGQERPAFETFLARGWDKNLYGDVTWA